MRRYVLSLLLMAAGARAQVVETLRPEELKLGMTGYGLSVFRGTEPERFNVEILGVLRNSFPKQDMILIRLSGAKLEQHKVISGMSGSPIYIEGKLIGALAYGWGFENEPLAGVTPIHNMMAELKRPIAPQPAPITARGPTNPADIALPRADNAMMARPVMTPMSLGGFSPEIMDMMGDEFRKWGWLPVAAGGAGPAAGKRPRGKIVPGGALGVEMIRGDMNAVGVGTVTYVEGDRVLAFGHPMFRSGQVLASAVQAEVQTVMSSMERSFKMAVACADAGALIGDWQSCVVADTTARAPMIPVKIDVTNRDTGHHETYNVEVIDNPAYTSSMVVMALAQCITTASATSRDTTVEVELEAELRTDDAGAKRAMRVSDTFYNPQGLLAPAALTPLTRMFRTPFGDPAVTRVIVNVQARQLRQTAAIKSAYFGKAEAERGEQLPLHVVIKPFGQPEETITVPVKVPAATDSMHVLSLTVLAGDHAPADIAPPDNLVTWLDSIEKQHHNTDLVILVQGPGQSLPYRGRLLKNLPPSIANVLDDTSTREITGAPDMRHIVVPTHWVLEGNANVRIPIREE